MQITSLSGCGTALITPFKIDLNVDYDTHRELVRRQIDSGIDFLVPLGTTAETPCLSEEEKVKILEITLQEADGKIPVIPGAGSNSTEQTIANVKKFEKLGADGFMIVTPYYNKPTQNGLYNHFKEVAGSTEKPLIMYNVPSRTGVNMKAETTLKLAEVSNIIAVKEASSDYIQINQIAGNTPEGFSVISGNDIETLALCVSGAKGVISVVSNIIPLEMSALTGAIMDGNFRQAKELHHKLTPLFNNCFIESNPIPTKAAMAEMGLIENVLRPPLYPATEETAQITSETISNLN